MPENRKRLLVICPHPVGVAPGQRLKYEQYFDYLRAHGYDVTVSPFMTRAFWDVVYQKGHLLQKVLWTLYGYLVRVFDLFRLPFYDGVYVFLWVVPFGPPVFEALYALLNPILIYDIDDLVFLKPKSRANPFIAFLKCRSRVTHLMRKARHVITCTPTLDAFARRYNRNTTDISSTINTDTYLPANRYANGGPITLGWSGSHATVPYLALLGPVMQELARESGFRLLVIGDANYRLEGVDVVALPWRAATEVADLRQIDIGLYPLPREEFALGKSGLKALQYMALGIPTVATAFGANFRVIEDGVSGFLVETEAEWKDRLRALMCDPDLRRRLGQAGRQRVERYYSVRANRDTYLGIVASVVASGRSRLPDGTCRPRSRPADGTYRSVPIPAGPGGERSG
jgi:glycosyltransferase involved in cell wall biosynthesis